MTTATSHTNTFLRNLQDSTISISDLALHVGIGRVDLPEVLDSPTRRWTWFAELLGNDEWGIATDLLALADICARAADLCRRTVHSDNLAGQWGALAADIAAAHQTHRGVGEPEVLNLLKDLALAGGEHCQGGDASGFEALLDYIFTLRKVRGPAARATLVWAAELDTELTSDPEPALAS